MQIISEFPRYMIDTNGDVYSCIVGRGKKARNSGQPQRKLKHVIDTTGYPIVTLTDGDKKRNRSIHRLLAEAYIPNPDNLPHVNHIDGNKANNALGNLEWVSIKENTQHAIRIGLTDPKSDQRCPNKKRIQQYSLDGKLLCEYESLHEAGRQTGIAWQNISKVIRGLRNTAGGFYWETSDV
jgi:hypothetical protein